MKYFMPLLTLILLTACGFEPVYGINRNAPVGVEDRLAKIEIGNIPDRRGQILRNELIDRFYRNGRPAETTHHLDIAPVQEVRTDLDITKTSDSTRGQLRLETQIVLTDSATGERVLESNLRSVTSYNQLSSEFATRVAEDNARQNALNDLAQQIELQIGLYFKKH